MELSIYRHGEFAKVTARGWRGAISYRDNLFTNAVPRNETCRSLAQLALWSSYQTVLTYS